jgi:RecB family endonuclease NucS
MSVEMAIWRMTDGDPVRLDFAALDSEKALEDALVRALSLTGLELLLVGRQIQTGFGGYVDIMGVDETCRVHIVELKEPPASMGVSGTG